MGSPKSHRRKRRKSRRRTQKISRTINNETLSLQRGGSDKLRTDLIKSMDQMITGISGPEPIHYSIIPLQMVAKRGEAGVRSTILDSHPGPKLFLTANGWEETSEGGRQKIFYRGTSDDLRIISEYLNTEFHNHYNDYLGEKLRKGIRELDTLGRELTQHYDAPESYGSGASSRASYGAPAAGSTSSRASYGGGAPAAGGASSGGGKSAAGSAGAEPDTRLAIDKTLQSVPPNTRVLVNIGAPQGFIQWDHDVRTGNASWVPCPITEHRALAHGGGRLYFEWGGVYGWIDSKYVPKMVIPIGYITLKTDDGESLSDKWVPAKQGDKVIYNGYNHVIHSNNELHTMLMPTSGSPYEVPPDNIHQILHPESILIQSATEQDPDITPGQQIYRSNDLTGTEYRVVDVTDNGDQLIIIKEGSRHRIDLKHVPVGDCTLQRPPLGDLSGNITIKKGMTTKDIKAFYRITQDPNLNGVMILTIMKNKRDLTGEEYLLQRIVPYRGVYYQVEVIMRRSSKQKTLTVQFLEPVGDPASHQQKLDQLNSWLI